MAEAAIVYPVLLMLLLAGASIGLGVFRAQEVAHLARESARWASLQPPSKRTPAEIMAKVVHRLEPGFDSDVLEVKSARSTSDPNMIEVTISYRWTPEFLLVPATLKSTARARVVDDEEN